MARPKARQLTERELEIMHFFWDASSADASELTAQQVRDALAKSGRRLAYTTVATLVRILHEKDFLNMTHDQRPFRYQAARSFDDVSSSILGDLVDRKDARGSDVGRLFRNENQQLGGDFVELVATHVTQGDHELPRNGSHRIDKGVIE